MGKFFEGCAEELTAHVRFWAWLTTPQADKKHKPLPSRLEKMRTDRRDPEYVPPLPEVSGHSHLLAHLFDVGPVLGDGSPVTHSEIAAFSENTGFELTSWETTMLRHMSREYAAYMALARDPLCPPPSGVATPSPVLTREQIAKRIAANFAGIMGRSKKGRRHEGRKPRD